MPDATNVFDYNRYMYARGNPMRYNDPDGHCATLPNGAADGNDSACWRYANTILAQWDNTPDYWNERFYSKDNFLSMASNSENHADGFHDVLTQYGKSAAYQAWAAQLQASWDQHWTLVPSVPTDAISVGWSFNSEIFMFPPISVGGTVGIELLAHRSGQIALYGYAGGGPALGAGGRTSIYVATYHNLQNADKNGGLSIGVDTTVAAIIGFTAGAFGSPGGSHGEKFGFVGGADLSVSQTSAIYKPLFIYDFADHK